MYPPAKKRPRLNPDPEGQEVRLSPRGARFLAIAAAACLACSQHQPDSNEYIGKVVMVGVSLSRPDGSGTRQLEVHGTVKEIDPGVGIVVSVSEPVSEFYLPPVLTSLRRVGPGEYRERNAGKLVEHADYATVWEAKMDSGTPGESIDWAHGMTWQRPLAFAFPGEHWAREPEK